MLGKKRREGGVVGAQPDPEADRRRLLERHARIKRVFIELHDYAFFHNPSQIGEVDDRFVGRSWLADRLRALLTSQQTKSGSYLVTGYRGVGKSSLVARVLSGISSGEARSPRASRYFRIFFPLPFLALVDVRVLEPSFVWYFLVALPAVFLLGTLVYLVGTDPDRRDIQAKSLSRDDAPALPRGVRIRRQLGNALRMDLDRHPDRRGRTLLQDYVYLSIIQITALTTFGLHDLWWQQPFRVTGRLSVYLVLYLVVVQLIVGWAIIGRARRTRADVPPTPPWRYVPWKVRVLARHVWVRITNYFNYSHRVYIKVNLGQDDLREKDILRLIARNIYTKYVEFKKFGWTDVWWRVLYGLFIYFGVGILYYYRPIYDLNQAARIESHLYFYFPSQVIPLLPEGTWTMDYALASGPEPAVVTIGEAPTGLASFWGSLADIIETESWPRKSRLDLDAVEAVVSGPRWSFRRSVMTVTSYADLFVYRVYRIVVTNLPWLPRDFPDRAANRITPFLVDAPEFEAGAFHFVPAYVDYLLVGYLLLGWILLRAVVRLRPFGVVTHAAVLRELRDLNDAMDAQVTQDDAVSASAPRPLSFLFSRRRTKVYPIANLREIEKRLLEILDEIDRVPRLTVRPDFVFIFDELDKIEPHQNVTLAQEDAEGAATPGLDPALSSYGATRERQQRILQLLSNLKHLFTTAKAKFIFIAGREMFDASLADVSDRHFFMGSIFNDVINVPSFLRDPSDDRLADVTSLTEAYLCQFLIPADFPGDHRSLHTFDRYLRSEVFKEPDGQSDVEEAERAWIHQRREKVVHDVANFIVYLTYRSNGAPKKVTRLLEGFVARPAPEHLKDDSVLCAGRSSGSLYLHFGFYDQYTFGLIAYLANPLFLSLNRANKDLGDKLLVSTSFLLDHLYKFHGFGFSWRNLELLPEIVDVNKAPELRPLIAQILGFLGKTHLQPILSGLHDFKFRKKITEEISFLSKVSESESAAFNFTLDESLPIKQYYNRRLRELLAAYHPFPQGAKGGLDFVHSLAFVRMILGDLHFYDEEYDHAIVHYMEAVQSLQRLDGVATRRDPHATRDPKQGSRESGGGDRAEGDGDRSGSRPDIRRLVLLIRNLLKLGLAFEKKKTYDSASLIYSQLTSYVVRFRDIDLRELGLRSERDKDGKPILRVVSDPRIKAEGHPEVWEECMFNRLLDALEFGPEVEDVTQKVMVFEGIRLLYQPLLAKLQIVEKSSLGGISVWDVRRTEREFDFIVKMLDRQVNFLALAEFKNKVGDILFYKNGPACSAPAKEETGTGSAAQFNASEAMERQASSTAFCLTEEGGRLCSANHRVPVLWEAGRHTPCSACKYYLKSLNDICDAVLSKAEGPSIGRSLIVRLFAGLAEPKNRNQRWSSLRELANSLSDVGDTFLSCCSAREEKLSAKFLEVVLSLIHSVPPAKKTIHNLSRRTWTKLEEAMLYYVLSAAFYKIAGEYKSHSHQLTKLLYVIRETVAIKATKPALRLKAGPPNKLWKTRVDEIERDLVSRIIRGIFRTYESTHRLEIEKLKQVFEVEDRPRFLEHLVHLNNVSVSRELREVIVILQEIRLSVTGEIPVDHHRFISPYGPINSMYNRIHELRYRGRVNYETLEQLGAGSLPERATATRGTLREARNGLFADLEKHEPEVRPLLGLPREPGTSKGRDLLEYLIVDSIFCFHQMLRCLQVFGLSYMANHSMRAAAHDKLALWCDCYYEYLKLLQPEEPGRPGGGGPPEDLREVHRRMEARLRDLIGPADLVTITPNYHKERALLHYRSVLQTHSEGHAYKQMLEEMYYLDDDLNDELTHFCAAMERFRINAGDIESHIERLSAEVKETALHEAQHYLVGSVAGRRDDGRQPADLPSC
jgi:hypothetical protein